MWIKLRMPLFVLLFSTFSCFSQELVQNDSASAITFTIKNFGFNVAGSFNDFTISSNFNSDNLKECFLNAEIRVNSIFTDLNLRDKHLLEADYFDVKKYPKIVFQSIEIQNTANAKYVLKGFITIKGIKRRLETMLEVINSKTGIVFQANFTLNRKDFGVGGNSLVLSDEVNIKIKYVATKN